MSQRTIRRTAAALVLAAVFALAAPAHAAGRPGWYSGSSWLEAAFQWVTSLWTGAPTGNRAGNDSHRAKAATSFGTTPNDPSSATQPQPKPNGDSGIGIDPNG
jgi:hypothetical protein